MNRSGFELLKQLDVATSDLKKILDKKLFPSQFLSFLSTYQVGSGSFRFEKIVLDDSDMEYYVLTAGKMYDEEIIEGQKYSATIDHIFSYDTLLLELDKYSRRAERWNEMGFVQIGLMYYGDVLLLGVEDSNRDEIWRYGQGIIGNPACKLEDNIFNFFRKLKETIDADDLKDWKIGIEQIYKNFNEDFWRVRR